MTIHVPMQKQSVILILVLYKKKKSLNDKIFKIVKLFIFNKLLLYKIVYNNLLTLISKLITA